MSTDTPLKIMAVSLLSKQRTAAYAVFNGEQLSIVKVETLGTGFFTSWRDKLIADVEEKVASGFAVIVEERTDLIAKYGTQYLLEEVGDEGRTNLQEALDWYFSMDAIGNIVFAEDTKRYQISSGSEGSKIDMGHDDKGRPIYKVDWNRLPGGFRSVLLCVVAAMQEPLSERFLNAVWPGMTEEEVELHPAQRMRAAIDRMDKERGQQLMKAQGGCKGYELLLLDQRRDVLR